MSRRKVLLVDDDPVTIEITRAVLESRGYRVVTRNQAIGTTASILRERPDVVLLDVGMPGLRGDEILKAIREQELLPRDRQPAFILHSGEDEATLDRLVAETGALGRIEKTGDVTAFAAAFESLLRGIQTPRPDGAEDERP